MKKTIYKLFSLAFALTLCSGTAFSQATYSFNYTGSMQSVTLQPGGYKFQLWGADGGNAPNGAGGIGGYSTGTLMVASTTTFYVYVGGSGTTAGVPAPGGWNGGGNLIGTFSSGTVCGSGGGGTDIRTTANTTYANRIIVAGGGGGGTGYGAYLGTGGNGGGVNGGNGTSSRGATYAGGGGSQTTGGTSATGGIPSYSQPGALGIGGDYTGTLGGSAGGGGYYGGGSGHWGGASGGGSGYIGGVGSGTTTMFGLPDFVAKPVVSGDGFVIITELCSIDLYAANTTNSLNPMICSGQSLTLTTNAISNYSWSTGATTSSLVVSPTTNTVFALTATSPSNCSTTKSISIIVNSAAPVLSVTQSTTSTCLGNTVNVNATGAITYTWSHGVSNNVTFTPAATAVYTVMGQNGCGISQATTAISVSQLPVTGVATPSSICENSTMQLSATGATSFTWEPINQTGSVVVSSASATTIFTVTGTSGNCMGQHTFAVVTRPNPTINIAATATQVCYGTPVTLTVTGADTYTWVQNLSGNIVTDTPTISTSYQVSGTNSVNCTAGNNYIVLVENPPVINTNLTATNICNGDQVQLVASGATNYTWSTGSNGSSLMASPSSFSVYTVTGGHNTNTCTAVKAFSVNPVTAYIDASPSASICMGAQITLTAGAGTGITWNPGGSFPILANISPASTTVYTVTAVVNTLNVNCPAVNMVTVTVHPNPSVTATAPQNSICRNEPIIITAQGAQTYSWSTGETGTSITYTSGSSGSKNITVEGTDNNGCKSTGSLLLQVNPCTGLSEWANADVHIYPNPSNGAITVKYDQPAHITVLNALGQTVKETTIENGSISISGLAEGIYTIQIDNGHNIIAKPVVITR